MIRVYLYAVAAVLVLTFTVSGISLVTQGTFLPWQERIRRDVFEQSQSFVHGKITQLNRLRMDHAAAGSPAHACAIRATALHEASLATELPDDLTAWITTLRKETQCDR